MGGEQSKPINATIELRIEAGEDKLRIEAGEVRHNGARRALNNQGTGKGQATREMNVRRSNQSRDGKCAGSGSLNVTRYGQSYGRLNRTNIGSGRSSGSLGLGSIQNMTQGIGTRGSGGPMRMRQSGVSGTWSKPAIEVITVTDSEDEEELDELEARLMRMVARRNGRRYVDINKRSQHETRGKYNAL